MHFHNGTWLKLAWNPIESPESLIGITWIHCDSVRNHTKTSESTSECENHGESRNLDQNHRNLGAITGISGNHRDQVGIMEGITESNIIQSVYLAGHQFMLPWINSQTLELLAAQPIES